MTREQVKRAKERERLCLSRWHQFNHYFPAFFFALIPAVFVVVTIYDWLSEIYRPKAIRPDSLVFWMFILIPIIVGILVFRFQRNQLKMTKIQVDLDGASQRDRIRRISKQLGWDIVSDTSEGFVSRTHPSFWSGSWGERITVIYDDNCIWVNSICDPDKRSSLVSCGRNKANVRAITKGLLNPTKRVFVT